MTFRGFIAIDPPDDVRAAMAGLQEQLKSAGADVRWEPPEKFHATIRFLGNVREELLPSLLETIEAVCAMTRPFPLAFRGLGGFPSLERPRIIWIGCENNDGELARLHEQLESGLHELGFETETRPFHPHVTIGRVKSLSGITRLTQMIKTLTFDLPPSACSTIQLMRSSLKPTGSEYTIIRSVPLTNA